VEVFILEDFTDPRARDHRNPSSKIIRDGSANVIVSELSEMMAASDYGR
jgi:hypothetical protein